MRELASKVEFRKANRLLNRIKSAGGRIAVNEALNIENISVYWWKDHKSWFLETFDYIRIESDPEEERPKKYLVNIEVYHN